MFISVLNSLCTVTDTEFTSGFVQTSLWYLAEIVLFCRLNLVLSLWLQSWRLYPGLDMKLPVSLCLLEKWALLNQANLTNDTISHYFNVLPLNIGFFCNSRFNWACGCLFGLTCKGQLITQQQQTTFDCSDGKKKNVGEAQVGHWLQPICPF